MQLAFCDPLKPRHSHQIVLKICQLKGEIPKGTLGLFCEVVAQSQRKVGLTASQTCDHSLPTWNETFIVELRPDEEIVIVKLFRESKKGTKEIGRLEFPIDELNPGNYVDNWYNVKSIKHKKAHQQIRLLLFYERTTVLPEHKYSEVTESLYADHSQLLVSIGKYADEGMDKLGPLICKLALHRNQAVSIIAELLVWEIVSSEDVKQLFNDDSVAQSALEHLLELVGTDWLKCIEPVIRSIAQTENISCEVVHSRMPPDSDLRINLQNLTIIVSNILLTIFQSHVHCPKSIRLILSLVRTGVKTKFFENCAGIYTAIGVLIFHRFFIPAIRQPKKYGLHDHTFRGNLERTTSLVTKVVDKLVEQSNFTQNEAHLDRLNSFIDENIVGFKEFIDKLTLREELKEKIVENKPNIDFYATLARLLNYVHKNREKLRVAINDREFNNFLKKVTALKAEVSALDEEYDSSTSRLSITLETPKLQKSNGKSKKRKKTDQTSNLKRVVSGPEGLGSESSRNKLFKDGGVSPSKGMKNLSSSDGRKRNISSPIPVDIPENSPQNRVTKSFKRSNSAPNVPSQENTYRNELEKLSEYESTETSFGDNVEEVKKLDSSQDSKEEIDAKEELAEPIPIEKSKGRSTSLQINQPMQNITEQDFLDMIEKATIGDDETMEDTKQLPSKINQPKKLPTSRRKSKTKSKEISIPNLNTQQIYDNRTQEHHSPRSPKSPKRPLSPRSTKKLATNSNGEKPEVLNPAPPMVMVASNNVPESPMKRPGRPVNMQKQISIPEMRSRLNPSVTGRMNGRPQTEEITTSYPKFIPKAEKRTTIDTLRLDGEFAIEQQGEYTPKSSTGMYMCFKCRKSIHPLIAPLCAIQRYYHPTCFNCIKCEKTVIDKFYSAGDRIFCAECFLKNNITPTQTNINFLDLASQHVESDLRDYSG